MLIDSHCHVPDPRYEQDIPEIIQDCKNDDVVRLINIGTSLKNNMRCIATAEKYPEIYSTVGIYPHEDKEKSIDELRARLQESLAKSKKIVAIGECGIDISNWESGREVKDQIEVFKMQIELAIENNLPLVIHNRNGDDIVLEILKSYAQKDLTGVTHCFTSTWETAKKFLDLGFYISFTAIITYPSRKELCEVLKQIPEDRILVETDAPYLPPQGFRGQVNRPKYVKMVAEKVAQIKEKPFMDICDLTYSNTCRLFGLPNL